jgi:anti-sigma regulatory factor (Ser/Thr protein kinase)
VAIARRAAVQFARCAGLFGEALADFEYAVGEALANAAEHGCPAGTRFSVYACVREGAVRIEIKDGGRGFSGWNTIDERKLVAQSPRGFGIFMMRTLVDEVQFDEGGSRIRIAKKLPVTGDRRICREA